MVRGSQSVPAQVAMSVDLRYRSPHTLLALKLKGSLYTGRLIFNGSPLYITLSIVQQPHETKEGRAQQIDPPPNPHSRMVVYYRRTDVGCLSPFLKYHMQPWITEAEMFYILKQEDTMYYDQILDLTRAALIEAEERRAFRHERSLLKLKRRGCLSSASESSESEA